MRQIPLIEGLRGYLAFWVVFDHLLGACGYPVEKLTGILKFLRSGWYAVDIFIIISGFVIFNLLDNKHESYSKFIAKRFFRLWPLYIFLFIISVPLSYIDRSNFVEFSMHFPYSQIGDGLLVERIDSWWENITIHILLHITMLQGIIPNSLLPYSPGAFLGPAWSISLEWQFYLIAPFIYKLLKKDRKWSLPVLSILIIMLFFMGRKISDIEYGSFLPMHIEYFFIGGLSYYLYKVLENKDRSIVFFPISLVLVSFILINVDYNYNFIPIIFWILFFTLLVDFSNFLKPNYVSYLSYLFQNKLISYLGKISYSVYLSHFLVIIIVQYIILNFLPLISQKIHLILLTGFSVFFTLIISHFTFKFIELFFIEKGKLIVDKI